MRFGAPTKCMRLSAYRHGGVVVTVPYGISTKVIAAFLRERSSGIIKQKIHLVLWSIRRRAKTSRGAEYAQQRDRALLFAEERVRHFSKFYGFTYQRISIRDQRTRWGSCSRKGNLSFNYRIVLLPPHLADYVVVHELCHLGAFDHSRKFWDLVARIFPRHHELRNELCNYKVH